jgi:hypothetical protein
MYEQGGVVKQTCVFVLFLALMAGLLAAGCGVDGSGAQGPATGADQRLHVHADRCVAPGHQRPVIGRGTVRQAGGSLGVVNVTLTPAKLRRNRVGAYSGRARSVGPET